MTPHKQFIALKVIVGNEIYRFGSIWVQAFAPSIITTTLYFLIFGQIIGQQLGKIGGYNFMDYIIPGLILMSVITNSYANAVSSFYSAKFQRCIEEMLISPMPVYIIFLGYVIGGIIRGLIVGVLVTLLVNLFFASLWPAHPLLFLSIMVLTATLFSIAGVVNAIYAKSFEDISVIPNFVLLPLTYLGGIFYSIDSLPGVWRDVSLYNPILYMVNAFRYSVLGISDIPVAYSLLLISAFIVAFGALALYLLNRGVGMRS